VQYAHPIFFNHQTLNFMRNHSVFIACVYSFILGLFVGYIAFSERYNTKKEIPINHVSTKKDALYKVGEKYGNYHVTSVKWSAEEQEWVYDVYLKFDNGNAGFGTLTESKLTKFKNKNNDN